MRTGSDTYSTIADLLEDVDTMQDTLLALRHALETLHTQCGADGTSVTGLGDIKAHFSAGNVTGWLRDVDALISWAGQLPLGLAENAPTQRGFQPQASNWLTYVLPERFIVCLWFDDSPSSDLATISAFIEELL